MNNITTEAKLTPDKDNKNIDWLDFTFKKLPVAALAFTSLWAGCRVMEYFEDPVDSIDNHSSFTVQEEYLTIGTDMYISDQGYNLGTVEQHEIAFRECYTYYDGDGHKLAKAVKRMLSVGEKIDIYDNEGELIGSVQEEVIGNLLSVENTIKF